MGTRIGRMTGINAPKQSVPPVKSAAEETAGRFISWDRPDFLVDATRPITIAPARKRSMVLNRAFIHRMLRCSLLMTALAAAPACAEQGFDTVAGSWSGGGLMKPSDGGGE